MSPVPPRTRRSGGFRRFDAALGRLRVRSPVLALIGVMLSVAPAPAALQDVPVNFYRYVLDIEPPESPALVALDAAPTHVYRATAPKPVATELAVELDPDGSARPAASVAVSPYFLAGGGTRPLKKWRSESLAGRLMRVLTKTVVSVGGGPDPLGDDALRGAVAIRSTLHDTHDPVGNTRVPERVREILDGLESEKPPLSDEGVAELSPEIREVLDGAARQMRARRDWLLSAGLGRSGTLRSGVLSSDSVAEPEWTLWANWQYTLGRRFDLLTTARALRLFGERTDLRLATGLQRKTAGADLLAELYFDTTDDRLHGGLTAEAHLARGLRAVTSLTTEPHRTGEGAVRRLRVRSMLRWYIAQ